uniref:Uncharacterized protein n=1 Tax=Candidatus Kentrum sp. LPFa TaxID=2126335 RepID=A0A450VND1_9GAMM|nr:MAG: hypothetical protein BECKLPF1236A_GA0070988_1000233 [Candidatus Kentron sp. LPFa]VFK23512.1 MAG: hypothetical protein BECKLPF1236C_GA0070990_1000611 [Candidatus Kentron sp. LPFa]
MGGVIAGQICLVPTHLRLLKNLLSRFDIADQRVYPKTKARCAYAEYISNIQHIAYIFCVYKIPFTNRELATQFLATGKAGDFFTASEFQYPG